MRYGASTASRSQAPCPAPAALPSVGVPDPRPFTGGLFWPVQPRKSEQHREGTNCASPG